MFNCRSRSMTHLLININTALKELYGSHADRSKVVLLILFSVFTYYGISFCSMCLDDI